MLRSYLPAIVFVGLGVTVGTAFALINSYIGPSKPGRDKADPYECGLPSEVKQGFECGIALERYQDVKVGDVIEAYQIEKIAGLMEA